MSFVQAEKDLPYADHAFGVTEGVRDTVENTVRHYTEKLGPIAHMRQVHGDRIVYAAQPGVYPEADALLDVGLKMLANGEAVAVEAGLPEYFSGDTPWRKSV